MSDLGMNAINLCIRLECNIFAYVPYDCVCFISMTTTFGDFTFILLFEF